MIKICEYQNGSVIRFDLARTIAGRGRYWTTAYLVDGLMVDTGCAHTQVELLDAIAEAHLQRIINTHTHEDHIGANGVLQRQRQHLEILAHPQALPVLADPRGAQPLRPYRRVYWGWPEPSTAVPVADGTRIETEKYNFQVIYTPGHSPDHLCLYEAEQGWLFSGDLFNGSQDRALRAGYDIWGIITSLKLVASLPAIRLFPGCARVRIDPQDEINAKIAYLEELGEQVLALHNQGCEVNEIARRLCGGPMWIEFITLGHFSRRRLILSYLGINKTGEA